jgi:AcrR family transcriptional regulator
MTVDPRIVHTRQVVRAAALAELAAVGFGGFTIESVAARAGVGKSTIYRHWDGHLHLIADTLESLNQQPIPEPDGGNARNQIEQLLRHFAEAMAHPDLSAAVPALVEASERHPAIAKFFRDYNARRRQILVDAIKAGVDAGELSPHLDAELTALALAGPILYRRLMTDDPFAPDEVRKLVTTVLGPPGV